MGKQVRLVKPRLCLIFLLTRYLESLSHLRRFYLINLHFRWDEWVPKSRLRWAVDKNEITHITPNDVVELWCCGANVRTVFYSCYFHS
jgi:hypothetical protein